MQNLKTILFCAGAAVAMFSACKSGEAPSQLTQSGLDAANFDTIIGGKKVALYTLKNANGMEVCITNYGGRVVSLVVPDKDGKPTPTAEVSDLEDDDGQKFNMAFSVNPEIGIAFKYSFFAVRAGYSYRFALNSALQDLLGRHVFSFGVGFAF